ncbi:MAG: (2Fe-2S)-binding protein [Deltaproteobacteria bacterium]|nr:(2Fe-2S)-binding protein [Deltaproteobacteria bacterium]
MIEFKLNGNIVRLEVSPDMPLLWVLRDILGLTGTKYGCGEGLCGACNVLLNDKAVHSCVTPVSRVQGMNVTTIEGLAAVENHPVLSAWIEEEAPECGYCQPGQIISATALLAENHSPTDSDIDEAMSQNLCRCGTYRRIRRAIHRARARMNKER